VSDSNFLGLPERTQRFIANWRVHAAHSLAMFYGAHLYLVGSALSREDAGDFDIRIPLDSDDWQRLFGFQTEAPENYLSEQYARKCREELKLNRRHTRWCGYQWRYDFQFQTLEGFLGHGGPQLQLDQVPEEHLSAGRTNP
jgi:hypothetical protein